MTDEHDESRESMSILLDTNSLLALRAYIHAKEKNNRLSLSLLREQEIINKLIKTSPQNALAFYLSEMSVVEMTVSHIRYHLYEFARETFRMPLELLYSRRIDALGQVRDQFSQTMLRQRFEGYNPTLGFENIKILPQSLSKEEATSWRHRQEYLFTRILQYELFETQDAYIVTSAIAHGIDEIWSTDKPLRGRINNLRNHHERELRDKARYDLGELFVDLRVPEALTVQEAVQKYRHRSEEAT